MAPCWVSKWDIHTPFSFYHVPLVDGRIPPRETLFGQTVTRILIFQGNRDFLNDAGQIAFYYELANGHKGIALATPNGAGLAPPEIVTASIANGASYLPGLVRGSWAQVKGSGFARTQRIWQQGDFSNDGTLPTSIEGIRVRIGGQDAPINFVSPTQISFQVPDFDPGPNTLQVIRDGVASNAVPITIEYSAPGLFTYAAGGKSFPAAVFANSAVIVGDPSISGGAVRKARSGERLQLYATGSSLPRRTSLAPCRLPLRA